MFLFFSLCIIIVCDGMFLAIRNSVEQNIDNVKDDGFSLSLVGKQEIKMWKLNPSWSEADFTIEIKQQEPVHIGPKPNAS